MDADAINRRIVAARTLRHISQTELDTLGAAEGLGKQELSRLERGELPLTRVRREALVRLLRVPETWFVAEDVDDLFTPAGAQIAREEDMRTRLRNVETQLASLVGAVTQLGEWVRQLDHDARQRDQDLLQRELEAAAERAETQPGSSAAAQSDRRARGS